MDKTEMIRITSLLIDALMNKEDIILKNFSDDNTYLKYHYSIAPDGEEEYLYWPTNNADSDVPRWYGTASLGNALSLIMNDINGDKKKCIAKPESISKRGDDLAHKRLTKAGLMRYATLLKKAIDKNKNITLEERHITGDYHMIYYEYDPFRLEYKVRRIKETYFDTPRELYSTIYLKKETAFSDIAYRALQEQRYVITEPKIDVVLIDVKFKLEMLRTMKNDFPQIFC